MRGGDRKGAGRKLKYGEPTKTVRLPASIADLVPLTLDAKMNDDRELCVWWTTGEQAKRLENFFESEPGFPEYLEELFWDRFGRPGWGRLWSIEPLGKTLVNVPFKARESGGIVLEKRHAYHIVCLPGLLQWDCLWSCKSEIA